MATTVLNSLLNSLASSLPAALSNVLSTSGQASAQIEQYVAQIEGAIDNPAMVALFAHDIMSTPSVPPAAAFIAAKIMTLSQNPATYNPTLVMSLCQAILSTMAQQNSSILGGLAGFAGTLTGTTTTTTTLG
jgi:hypothetical protein